MGGNMQTSEAKRLVVKTKATTKNTVEEGKKKAAKGKPKQETKEGKGEDKQKKKENVPEKSLIMANTSIEVRGQLIARQNELQQKDGGPKENGWMNHQGFRLNLKYENEQDEPTNFKCWKKNKSEKNKKAQAIEKHTILKKTHNF